MQTFAEPSTWRREVGARDQLVQIQTSLTNLTNLVERLTEEVLSVGRELKRKRVSESEQWKSYLPNEGFTSVEEFQKFEEKIRNPEEFQRMVNKKKENNFS